MKISLVKTEYDTVTVCEDGAIPTGWVRLSEWVDIDFKELPKATTISCEINLIELAINKIKDETMKQIEVLNNKKQNLLALTEDEM